MLISAVPLELARATTKSPANGTKMRTAALMIFPGRILGCYKFKVIVTFHFQIFLKVVIFQVSSCDVNLIQYSHSHRGSLFLSCLAMYSVRFALQKSRSLIFLSKYGEVKSSLYLRDREVVLVCNSIK